MPSLSSKITRKKISKFYGLVQCLIFSVSKNEFAENGRIFTIIHDNLFTRLVTNKTSTTKSISSVNLFNLLWTYNNLLLASKTLSIIFITLVSSLLFLCFKISTFFMDMESPWSRIFFKVVRFLQPNNRRLETYPKILAQSEVYYTTTKGVRTLHGSKFLIVFLFYG